jgi:hypothetical protein
LSSSGAAPAASTWLLRRLRARTREEAPAETAAAVAFPELVWAHYQYVKELHEDGVVHGPAEAEYHRLLERFSEQHGRILNAYWCTSEASAVALTEQRGTRVYGFLWRRLPDIRFHSATDWVTRDAPELGHALHTCETLGIRAAEVLNGTAERITMQWILSVAGYILGVVDQADGKPSPEQARVAARRTRLELAQVEAYYDRVGDKSGRLVYFAGMMHGVFWLGVLAVVGAAIYSLFGNFDRHDVGTQTFFICYGMGAVGAVVSVMSRMASDKEGSFSLDYEVGRRAMRRVGSFRPVIGAIFAVILYIALRGGLLQLKTPPGHQTTFFYATLAFLAGFSERRASIVLGGAERVLGGAGAPPDDDEQAQARPAGVHRRPPTGAGSTG